LLTDSFHSRKQIFAYFRKIKCRLEVVYPPVEGIFKPITDQDLANVSILNNYKLSKPYIVYHGGFRKYKRVERIVKVFDKLRSISETPLKLCIIGKKDCHFKQNVEEPILASRYASDIICAGRVSDADLRLLLGLSECYIYLSECEGFGFPPLEAALCGAKVVCINVESMPELLADYPIWVSGSDTDNSIAETVKEFVLDARDKQKVFNINESCLAAGFVKRMIRIYEAMSNINHNC
jgi:glycosyltransferase involved in cell wall biosynthesis